VEPIRVFVADDHELVRFAMRTLLEAQTGIEVVGEASDTQGAISGCQETAPDVLLLDMRMPGDGGVEVCRRVKEYVPDTAVLVLTSFDEDDELFGVLSAGAAGYILKDTRPEHVVDAIRSVAAGQSVFDASVATRIISVRANSEGTDAAAEALSARELEVLRLMAKGLTNKEIGQALWIGETTVKTHVSHILHKMGQADRTQAVLAAVKDGVVQLDG